jgi:hypothetical protein
MSVTTNSNGYVKASDGFRGFDAKAWKESTTEEQRRNLRRIWTAAGRSVYKHVAAIRKATKALIQIDKNIKKQAEEAVGGQQALEAVFGCKDPLSFDTEDHDASGAIVTPGFEDILEATENLYDQVEQLAESPSSTFLLPQED